VRLPRAPGELVYRHASSLLLVAAGESFKPPLNLDDPEIRDAYDQGLRSAGTRSGPRVDVLERLENMGRDARRAYLLGAHHRTVQAPASWPVEAALIAAESVVIVWGSDVHGPRQTLVQGPSLAALIVLTTAARQRAQRHRARQLGLTPLTAPQPIVRGSSFVIALMLLVLRLNGRVRGESVEPPDWTVLVARHAIAHITRQRSWRRAMRRR
jgi:hypothetical protein